LRIYCNDQENKELPDVTFIIQFLTSLFQTKIFKNFDQCLNLLKNSGNTVVVEHTNRKSTDFKSPKLDNGSMKIRKNSGMEIGNNKQTESELYKQLMDLKLKC